MDDGIEQIRTKVMDIFDECGLDEYTAEELFKYIVLRRLGIASDIDMDVIAEIGEEEIVGAYEPMIMDVIGDYI